MPTTPSHPPKLLPLLRPLGALGIGGLLALAPTPAEAQSTRAPQAAVPSKGAAKKRSGAKRKANSAEARARIAERRKLRIEALKREAAEAEKEADSLGRRARVKGVSAERVQELRRSEETLRKRAERARKNVARMEAGTPPPAQRHAQLKAARKRLQASQRARLKRQWGKTLEYPRARQEIRKHAERVAKLMRIRALATDAGDGGAITRCDALLSKEGRRHRHFMDAFDQVAKREAAKPPRASGATKGEGHATAGKEAL